VRLALLLVPSLAFADARFEAHAGGGMEGGLIQGKPRPDGVAELGIGASYFGNRHGVGIMVERVSRPSADIGIASEYKLDLLVQLRKQRFHGGIGVGLRRIEVDGPKDSTLWGVDLARMRADFELARIGRVGVAAYVSWTFGLYRGEVFGERFGDMAYPTRDYSTMVNSYVFGLATTFHTNP
jgi:hypothetical protein